MTSALENNIKDRLGIKWVDARRLREDAQDALGITISGSEGREEDVLLEAQKRFESLSSAEQEERRVPEGGDDEPEWNRKAREQAERREREWEEQANAVKKKQEREEAIARGEPVEDEIKGPKKIIQVTRTTKDGDFDPEVVEIITQEKLEGHHIKYTKVTCCTLL
jgi:hypothetical protein